MGTTYALKKQFGEEFGLDTSKVEDRVCEREWVGVHGGGPSPTRSQEMVSRVWTGFDGSGMNGYLKIYEARYWILLERSVAGEGFEGEMEGMSPVLGPGWMGWGRRKTIGVYRWGTSFFHIYRTCGQEV